MPDIVYKTKKKQKLKPLPSVRKQYKNAKIDSGDARQRLKDLVSSQKAGIGIGPGTYTRAILNGKIVYNGTMLNDEGLPIPDPRYGLIMSGEYVQGLRGPYKDLGHDVRVGVPMIMEVIPGTGMFSKNRIVVNYLGDPGYLDAQNRLAEAYNINGGNIMIGDEEKPYLLPELLILYRKNGGTIKKLIPKHLLGGSVEDEDPNIVWDAVKSITPGVGTYYDIKKAVNDPTVGNILGAGASLGSDLALLVPGVGWIAQANRARKAGKIASLAWKAAGQYYKWGRNATRSAQELDKAANTAKKVGDVRKYDKYRSEAGKYKTAASDLNKRMKTADLLFINASKQKKAAKAAIESYKNPMLVGAAGRIADADVNAYRDLLKKLNLVEKRNNPYLYNNFTH